MKKSTTAGLTICLLLLGAICIFCGSRQQNPAVSTPASSTTSKPRSQPHGPFFYDYASAAEEIPFEVFFGNRTLLHAWKEQMWSKLNAEMRAIPLPLPQECHLLPLPAENENVHGPEFHVYRIHMPLPGINDAHGGLLAVPHNIDPQKPLIIAVHGHEVPTWGTLPFSGFEQGWMRAIAQAGYVVYASISMYHQEIAAIAEVHSYPLTWAKLISDAVDTLESDILRSYPHTGIGVMGLSSGGVTGWTLMAWRKDIKTGVFGGSLQPLDFLRREYRIQGHPDCWDMPFLRDYTAVLALTAPRPVLFLEGEQDSFFPRAAELPATASFSGTTRGVLSRELLGTLFMLQQMRERERERERERALFSCTSRRA